MEHDPRIVAQLEGALIRARINPAEFSTEGADRLLSELSKICLAVMRVHTPRPDDGLYPACPACGTPTPEPRPDMVGASKLNGLAEEPCHNHDAVGLYAGCPACQTVFVPEPKPGVFCRCLAADLDPRTTEGLRCVYSKEHARLLREAAARSAEHEAAQGPGHE